jgi:serine/threonine-protein kinase RsbW
MTKQAPSLVLESHPKNIAEVEPFVNQVLQEYDMNQDIFGNILITLTEAVSNAILHGNRARTHKKVFVSTRCSAQTISFVVKDEGTGFDPDILPDPTAPENICTPGGRGVFLMRQLCDTVAFSEGGSVVELGFNRF